MKTIEYKLISNKDKDKLTIEINNLLQEGREPYGSPMVDPLCAITQAMIKQEEIIS